MTNFETINRRYFLANVILAVFATSWLSTIADGQTYQIVTPSKYATTEAPGRVDVSTIPSYRGQQVYAASEFAALPPGPKWLTRLDYRLDGSLTEPLDYPSERWIVKFSTTSKTPENLDVNFAANTGPDEQTVIDGPVTISSTNQGPAGGPKVFDYGVDLSRPFRYEPSKGNLLWDLTVINGSGPLSLDWILSPNLTAGQTVQVSTDDINSPTANPGWRWGGHVVQYTFVDAVIGDFDGNGVLDALDIDDLSARIRGGGVDSKYDLDGNGSIDQADRTVWVTQLKRTYFGDANLEGEFSSGDLVAVFTTGQYEDAVPLNSTWSTGDWNGDGEFDSADFVLAFQDGGYQKGPRAVVNAVPEPSTLVLVLTFVLSCVGSKKRSGCRQTSVDSRRRSYWEIFGR